MVTRVTYFPEKCKFMLKNYSIGTSTGWSGWYLFLVSMTKWIINEWMNKWMNEWMKSTLAFLPDFVVSRRLRLDGRRARPQVVRRREAEGRDRQDPAQGPSHRPPWRGDLGLGHSDREEHTGKLEQRVSLMYADTDTETDTGANTDTMLILILRLRIDPGQSLTESHR